MFGWRRGLALAPACLPLGQRGRWRPEAEEAEEAEETGAEAEEERRLKLLLKERVEWCGDEIRRKSERLRESW